jgi:nucleoside-diphosphate kinase
VFERTLILIKPDAICAFRTGIILDRAERLPGGARTPIADLRRFRSSLIWTEFYIEHMGRSFFGPMIKFMGHGPVVAAILEGDDVIKRWRRELGATDPREAAPWTVRGCYGDKYGPMFRNAAHGSDSAESAEREIGIVFGRSKP